MRRATQHAKRSPSRNILSPFEGPSVLEQVLLPRSLVRSDMKGGGSSEYEEPRGAIAHLHHPQPLQKRECLSDEVDSEDQPKKSKKEGSSRGGQGDGATIEVARRPRGRPPGSKNKPKPPVIITREAEPSAAMRPHVLEIPAGHDVVDSLARFSRRRNLGICVLAGTGSVANVTLRQPPAPGNPNPSSQATTIGFRGRFEILSISATFLPPALAALSPAPSANLSISLAGPQGQIVGGTVAGPLMAAGTVVVVAAAFSNPTYHRLPVEDDVSVSVSVSVTGSGDADPNLHAPHQHKQEHEQQHQHHNHHQQHHHHHAPVSQAASAAEFYSCHLSSDVIWAPTVRPPPPY